MVKPYHVFSGSCGNQSSLISGASLCSHPARQTLVVAPKHGTVLRGPQPLRAFLAGHQPVQVRFFRGYCGKTKKSCVFEIAKMLQPKMGWTYSTFPFRSRLRNPFAPQVASSAQAESSWCFCLTDFCGFSPQEVGFSLRNSSSGTFELKSSQVYYISPWSLGAALPLPFQVQQRSMNQRARPRRAREYGIGMYWEWWG